jgi:hypothetical protein
VTGANFGDESTAAPADLFSDSPIQSATDSTSLVSLIGL